MAPGSKKFPLSEDLKKPQVGPGSLAEYYAGTPDPIPHLASKYYTKAADRGHVESQMRVAREAETETIRGINLEKAKKYYLKAMIKHEPTAQEAYMRVFEAQRVPRKDRLVAGSKLAEATVVLEDHVKSRRDEQLLDGPPTLNS